MFNIFKTSPVEKVAAIAKTLNLDTSTLPLENPWSVEFQFLLTMDGIKTEKEKVVQVLSNATTGKYALCVWIFIYCTRYRWVTKALVMSLFTDLITFSSKDFKSNQLQTFADVCIAKLQNGTSQFDINNKDSDMCIQSIIRCIRDGSKRKQMETHDAITKISVDTRNELRKYFYFFDELNIIRYIPDAVYDDILTQCLANECNTNNNKSINTLLDALDFDRSNTRQIYNACIAVTKTYPGNKTSPPFIHPDLVQFRRPRLYYGLNWIVDMQTIKITDFLAAYDALVKDSSVFTLYFPDKEEFVSMLVLNFVCGGIFNRESHWKVKYIKVLFTLEVERSKEFTQALFDKFLEVYRRRKNDNLLFIADDRDVDDIFRHFNIFKIIKDNSQINTSSDWLFLLGKSFENEKMYQRNSMPYLAQTEHSIQVDLFKQGFELLKKSKKITKTFYKKQLDTSSEYVQTAGGSSKWHRTRAFIKMNDGTRKIVYMDKKGQTALKHKESFIAFIHDSPQTPCKHC